MKANKTKIEDLEKQLKELRKTGSVQEKSFARTQAVESKVPGKTVSNGFLSWKNEYLP